MLKLISLGNYATTQSVTDFNTSHVKVNQSGGFEIEGDKINFNTSHVKVNHMLCWEFNTYFHI